MLSPVLSSRFRQYRQRERFRRDRAGSTRRYPKHLDQMREHVGQRNLAVTANTYSHVLADEEELDYAGLIGW